MSFQVKGEKDASSVGVNGKGTLFMTVAQLILAYSLRYNQSSSYNTHQLIKQFQ